MATVTPLAPARWRQAAERARSESVTVAQVAGSGAWIATSGTQPGVAYALAVTGNVAHGCDCPAGQHEDDVCKHRAAFYLSIGAIPSPEEERARRHAQDLAAAAEAARIAYGAALGVTLPPPDLAAMLAYEQEIAARCPACHGAGSLYVRDCERAGFPFPTCPDCGGSGYK